MNSNQHLQGEIAQASDPNWAPLERLLKDESVVGDFMWMFAVELSDGSRLDAYKHWHTRRYIHLTGDGRAFAFAPPNYYLRWPATEILEEVFASLPGLAGGTPERIAASWAAAERVRRAA